MNASAYCAIFRLQLPSAQVNLRMGIWSQTVCTITHNTENMKKTLSAHNAFGLAGRLENGQNAY